MLKNFLQLGILGLVFAIAGTSIVPPPLVHPSLVRKMVETGLIDKTKKDPQALSDLNLLWAFGLANKNEILEKGPMRDPKYGGAENFASTGGWTLAKGNAMDHYGMHEFVKLTPEQQKKVEHTSKRIFRPCCSNSAYFPDCNHGMAMLGYLELLASQGASEKEMLERGNTLNKTWFGSVPDSGCRA